MDDQRIAYLFETVRAGSIRAAAKRLLIAQPALSRSLRAMESDLGIALFERSSRGIVPTQYAEVLIQYARLMDATLQSSLPFWLRLLSIRSPLASSTMVHSEVCGLDT